MRDFFPFPFLGKKERKEKKVNVDSFGGDIVHFSNHPPKGSLYSSK